jgi:hypothetical protein
MPETVIRDPRKLYLQVLQERNRQLNQEGESFLKSTLCKGWFCAISSVASFIQSPHKNKLYAADF